MVHRLAENRPVVKGFVPRQADKYITPRFHRV